MSKPLSVGDKVLCRLFNTPDGKFYGEPFVGEIINIGERMVSGDYLYNWPQHSYGEICYEVTSPERPFPMWLKRKEIKRRIKS